MELTYVAINVGILIFYVVMFISGYKKGFVLQLLDLVGLLLIVYVSWLFSPVLATYFEIWPKDMVPLYATMFGDAIYSYVNQLVWFICIFIVLKIILMLFRPIVKVLQNIPILKQCNRICGAVFSVVYSTVWILLLSFVLTLPLIPNGHIYVANSWMKTIMDTTSQFIQGLEDPLLKNDTLTKLVDGMNELSENDRADLKQWFEENKLDEVGN